MQISTEPVDINRVNQGLIELIVDFRFKIKATDDIEIEKYILDPALLLLNEKGKIESNKDFIYFNNPVAKEKDFPFIENLPDEERVYYGESLNGRYDKVDKIYSTKSTQFKLLLDAIPERVKSIKLIFGLYGIENSGYTLKNLKEAKIILINSGLEVPEIFGEFSRVNYYKKEQASILATITEDRGIYTFTPKSLGIVGNIINIYKIFKQDTEIEIREKGV